MTSLRRLALAIGLAILAVVGVGVGAPATADDGAPGQAGVWFGPDLDWTADAPAGYRDRLGVTPSLYSIRISYPLDGDAREDWRSAARAGAEQGAVLVVSLEPRVGLDALTPGAADDVRELADEIHEQYDTHQLLRFAAEMNGSWVAWGHQPLDYVRSYRELAHAVRAGASDAEMVWAPSYGAGYPFDRADGRLQDLTAADVEELDTNGDGTVSELDDPYGPYYPGADVVDRAGLSMYYFGKGARDAAAGTDVPLDGNRAPGSGEVAARLDESWGYTSPQQSSFYDRYSPDHPLVLETGALWAPERGGDGEEQVKHTWWTQVLDELATHPRITAVTWLELQRPEAEVGGDTVDWRSTALPPLAESFRASLEDSDLIELGPVTDVVTPEDANRATEGLRAEGAGSDPMAWIVGCAAVLAIAFLVALPLGRWRPAWRYPDDGSPRDLRIDLVRGFLIVVVVATHIEVTSPYSYLSLRAIGAITGAEMFVFLSGVVLGITYPIGVRRLGEWRAAVTAWGRARKQYLVTLAVVLIVFVLGFLPFVETGVITTFTDRGTGLGGGADAGRVYDLYPNVMRLLDYPPPWYAVRQLLLLEMGPWVINIMGLFVALSLFIPPIAWLLRRRCWWLVLALSWGVFALQYAFPALQPVPSQFNAVFPLMVWQVLFTHGLVLGHYRRQVVAALTGRLGLLLTGVFVVGYAGVLVYLWAGHTYGFTPAPFSAGLYESLNDRGYQRVDLQWGRLIDVVFVTIVAYAVLTRCWKPIHRVAGWLWIPLGQASLYVFVVHTFFVLAVGNIPGLDRTSWWHGTIVHTVAIAAIWLMVRRKVLFSVVPR